MKPRKFLSFLCLAIFATACQTSQTAETPATSQPAANAATTSSNAPVTFPFADFPAVETTAKPGDYVLCPSYNWLQDANAKGVEKVTFIWYAQKMAMPGNADSEIQFMTDKKRVPNAYLIEIPRGQKAKIGDVILTWWQTGSGMKRAIVTDAADPAAPTVRYLDIEYDNPAKSSDGSTTIGKMDEKIKPDTFFVLKNAFDPGTGVAISDGANQKHGQVIRAAGDKVFVREFAGKIGVYDKKISTPVPIIPAVKTGDRVKALWVGTFKPATVGNVDSKIGRVFVKFDGEPEEKAIAFGDVMK